MTPASQDLPPTCWHLPKSGRSLTQEDKALTLSGEWKKQDSKLHTGFGLAFAGTSAA